MALLMVPFKLSFKIWRVNDDAQGKNSSNIIKVSKSINKFGQGKLRMSNIGVCKAEINLRNYPLDQQHLIAHHLQLLPLPDLHEVLDN